MFLIHGCVLLRNEDKCVTDNCRRFLGDGAEWLVGKSQGTLQGGELTNHIVPLLGVAGLHVGCVGWQSGHQSL